MSKELELLQQLQASVKEGQDKVLATAENALKEAQNVGVLHAETKQKVDELLAGLNADRQKLNDLQVQLGEAEQAFAALPNGKRVMTVQSLGERVINGAGVKEALQAMLTGANTRVSVPVQAAITSVGTSAGALIEPDRVGLVAPQVQRLTVRDLLAWGKTDSNSVQFVKETGFTNNAAVQKEGELKAESNITFAAQSADIATIAHWIPATKQVLADIPMLQSYINQRLLYGLKLAEEKQLLHGTGLDLNIKGLMTQATAYANPGVTVTAETAVDRLRLAILQAELADVSVDGVVLNPIDWGGIELLKATNNEYLFADPFGQMIPRLWALPVVATKSMTKDNFLVGGFRSAAQGWDREDANIAISTENGDNFVKNMVTIRCEERVGLTVFRPEAFVKGTFS